MEERTSYFTNSCDEYVPLQILKLKLNIRFNPQSHT